jgi:hypothetical protein
MAAFDEFVKDQGLRPLALSQGQFLYVAPKSQVRHFFKPLGSLIPQLNQDLATEDASEPVPNSWSFIRQDAKTGHVSTYAEISTDDLSSAETVGTGNIDLLCGSDSQIHNFFEDMHWLHHQQQARASKHGGRRFRAGRPLPNFEQLSILIDRHEAQAFHTRHKFDFAGASDAGRITNSVALTRNFAFDPDDRSEQYTEEANRQDEQLEREARELVPEVESIQVPPPPARASARPPRMQVPLQQVSVDPRRTAANVALPAGQQAVSPVDRTEEQSKANVRQLWAESPTERVAVPNSNMWLIHRTNASALWPVLYGQFVCKNVHVPGSQEGFLLAMGSPANLELGMIGNVDISEEIPVLRQFCIKGVRSVSAESREPIELFLRALQVYFATIWQRSLTAVRAAPLSDDVPWMQQSGFQRDPDQEDIAQNGKTFIAMVRRLAPVDLAALAALPPPVVTEEPPSSTNTVLSSLPALYSPPAAEPSNTLPSFSAYIPATQGTSEEYRDESAGIEPYRVPDIESIPETEIAPSPLSPEMEGASESSDEGYPVAAPIAPLSYRATSMDFAQGPATQSRWNRWWGATVGQIVSDPRLKSVVTGAPSLPAINGLQLFQYTWNTSPVTRHLWRAIETSGYNLSFDPEDKTPFWSVSAWQVGELYPDALKTVGNDEQVALLEWHALPGDVRSKLWELNKHHILFVREELD